MRSTQGQAQAQKLDYVPLPDALVKQIETYIGASHQVSCVASPRRRPQERRGR